MDMWINPQRMKTIWFCQDEEGYHGFGPTKKEAEYYVYRNRGYDRGYENPIKSCVEDGWCKRAVRIKVPSVLVPMLLESCE